MGIVWREMEVLLRSRRGDERGCERSGLREVFICRRPALPDDFVDDYSFEDF